MYGGMYGGGFGRMGMMGGMGRYGGGFMPGYGMDSMLGGTFHKMEMMSMSVGLLGQGVQVTQQFSTACRLPARSPPFPPSPPPSLPPPAATPQPRCSA